MKKLLIIIVLALFVSLGVLLYLISARRAPEAADTVTPDASPTAAATGLIASPAAAAEKTALRLSETPALPSLHANSDGSVSYYTRDGAWRVTPGADATPETLSEVDIADLFEVAWSPSGKQVITTRQSDVARANVFYDYATSRAQPIIPAARAFVWSPTGNAIAYQEKDDSAGVNQIIRSSPRGEDPRIVFKTRVALWRLYWPVAERMFVAAQPSGLAAGTLFTLNPQDGLLQKLFTQNGLIANPAPDGKRVLYSHTDNRGDNLTLSLSEVGTAHNRNLTAEFGLKTLAEKCVWTRDAKAVVCAVFSGNPDGSVMPDDYYKGVFTSSERIVRLNVETGERAEIALESSVDVALPVLTNEGGWFVFINRADGMVYGVKLAP
ncbi:MAG: hypothetical protein Q8R13_05900 [bacterium]|nr:hypothetical protein [bacterium]MDZ4296176.1 hypothetical protein [Patescibacteria group bacterium]